MRKVITKILCLLLLCSGYIFPQKIIIEGTVKDEDNKPLPFVNVFLMNTTDGGMTDEDGAFHFKTSETGMAELIASMVGYTKYTSEIDLSSSAKHTLDIVLSVNAITLSNTFVTASSYGSEKEKGLVISRIDILTTPGGATDLYQSLKTMPGVTQVSESAELYVRGGDPIETVTMINQSVVYHPFTFESAYGGIFSNINQSSLKSMYFTSGGFSAKYGNVLSGVLDIETKNQPQNTYYNLGLSLASGNLSADIAIDPEKFGLYFDARQSFTAPIFWLNGGSDRMVNSPSSKNFSGGAVYSYSETGRFKLFTIYADDKQGVNVERAEYNGTFNGNTVNRFVSLQNTDILFNKLIIKNSAAYNKYSNSWKFGILDITKTDYVASYRGDFELLPGRNIKILSGVEYEWRKILYEGKIPQEDYDIRPEAAPTIIDASFYGNRFGLYGEVQTASIFGITNLSGTAGIRYDNIPGLNMNWLDPRAGIGYKPDESSTLRLAWGKFRQFPDPRLFSPVDGNPELKPMQAEHFIASYEYVLNEQNSFRVEIYRKNYKNLPRENDVLNYDNSGDGFANGVDFIFKGIFPFGINGWLSYGYLNTKRNWMDYDIYTSSDYDITHNVSLVAKYNLSEKFQVGITAKYATGRPYTPTIGSEYRDDINIYEPVYALTNSSRFPDYKRIDLRITYFSQLLGSYNLIAFIEGINIFNFNNIFGYSYSPDYTERKEIESYFGRRMLVLGFSVGFN
ncbi:MAG: TonB-dependent receptor [Ignavibacteriaceae bacterium]